MTTVPAHRFPEFQDSITSLKVSEIAKVTSGGTPSRRKASYWDGRIPWVTTSLIAFNRIGEALEFITEEGLANSAAKLFPKGTLIMALYGQGVTRGKVAILDFEATTNQACAALLIQRDDVDTDFLFYELQRRYDELRNLSNDGGQKNLSGDLVKNLRITLPSLPEQQKIADFLTAVDQRVDQLVQKKALLEDYKKGVMQQLFTQAIRFKDDNGNEFPEWEERKLGEIGATYSGLSGKSGDDFGSGKPFVTYKQIFDKTTIDLKDCGKVKIAAGERQNRVTRGDILFTNSSETRLEVGYTSVVLENTDEIYLNSFCFGFRSHNSDELMPEFARYLFHSGAARRAITVLGQGSTRYNISKNQLMKVSFKFPSLPEQTKIADFLSAIDRKIESVDTQITETQTFKKGLLQQMFV